MIAFTDARGCTTYLSEPHIVMIHAADNNGVIKVEMTTGTIFNVDRDQARRIVQILEGSNI